LLVHIFVYKPHSATTFVHETKNSMKEDISTAARYVDAAMVLHGLTLTAEQRQRVIDTFALNTALIAPLLDFPFGVEIEQAPVFKA
jgi:hypothetical protein